MAWIKYIACYKSGYGQPEWIDVGDSTPDGIKYLFEEHDREHGDPEGFRTGKYEVFDVPPVTVLEGKIKQLARQIETNQAYLIKLWEMHKQASRRVTCPTCGALDDELHAPMCVFIADK